MALKASFFYCDCYDYKRQKSISFRADRFLSAERVGGFEQPAHIPLEDWMDAQAKDDERIAVRAYVTERGAKSFEVASLFDRMENKSETNYHSELLETQILRSDIDYWATRFLSLGAEVRVQSPPELVEVIRAKVREAAAIYC